MKTRNFRPLFCFTFPSTSSLRSADAFPVVASLPPKNSYFFGGREATVGNASGLRRLFYFVTLENSVRKEKDLFWNMPLLIWLFRFDHQTETTAVYRYTPCLTQELPPGRYFIHGHWLIGLGWDLSIEESFTSIFWASPLSPTLSFWNYATCYNNNDSNINNDWPFPDLCNSFFF